MLLPSMGTVVFLCLLILVCTANSARFRDRHKRKDNNGLSPANNRNKTIKLMETRRSTEFVSKKVCIGTNGRMSVPSNRDHHYRNLKDRFTNCTYVDGNLELTWLQDENLDLSFLQHIREVTGYVLVSHVDIKRIVLPRLQIIRGRTLFKLNVSDKEFALIVTLSKMYSLEMPALRDVLNGSVGVISNYNLCHIKSIDWKEIISGVNSSYVYSYNFTSPERECAPCHKNCERGCWGEGEENCQQFSKLYCSPQCSLGRCYGPNPRECCHLFCAGGCTGPTQRECIACKDFYDDGECTSDCPPMQVYNPSTYAWDANPKGKYAYGATCVKSCPEHLLKDYGACVRSCPPNKKPVDGECVLCDGPCPKTCKGDVTVHSGNIESFRGCTIIEGFLHILETSFRGMQQVYSNYTFGERQYPLHPDALEVFSTIKEITGFLSIQAYHDSFKNLSYFRNLETIGGRTHYELFASLYIVKTSLESLELSSLKQINSGGVTILENDKLCYAETINWRKITKSTEHKIFVKTNGVNCSTSGYVCDGQCDKDGCWGDGPSQCLSCNNVRFENSCLENCSGREGLYAVDDHECKRCDNQCGSCYGPGPDKCISCKRFKDGNSCVENCTNKYPDSEGICRPCPSSCHGGCTGPSNVVGRGGCNQCYKVVIKDTSTECIYKEDNCPDGYYLEMSDPIDEGRKVIIGNCRKCHPRCKTCSGFGFHIEVCQQCAYYKNDELCVDECPSNRYPNNETLECLPCNDHCKGCTGPGANNCTACENLKVYEEGDPTRNLTFTCVETCPPEFPFRIYAQDTSETYCSADSSEQTGALVTSKTPMMIVIGLTIVITFSIIAIVIICYWCRKFRDKKDVIKMTMTMTGLEDNEPLQPTNVLPNLAQLRIIKEAEMRKGGLLGFGAFGTVYKGVWVPETENNKIPVAIKVLREDAGINTSKEFLSEAYIMASVDHPNLLQLLGVCMTTQMMLVTQLMPLGCLLDFVRKNREKIGSKLLLTWCTQIAKGMAYLEENRLVHRDLAARNVLIQTLACVKITDFGLAKLLDINEEEYKAAGGKMPIKWLALECIQHRIFTHKSDVWAFGVTVWELLTFGRRPYDGVPARDVPDLLEHGERLPQPLFCSIDIYMIMLKCWMLDAESRPGFKELADDFTKMSRDPGRYLAIAGDQHSRLQNYPTQEEKDSSVEQSVSHSDNDDSLQPKSRAPLSSNLSVSSSPPNSSMKLWSCNSNMTSDGSCAPQNQHNWNQERLRFAQSRGLDPNSLNTMHSADSSIAYCGDSLKYKSDEIDSGRSQAQVGNLKLELPVDEDDYLVPSPQQNQNASTYVDLIGDSKTSDSQCGSDYRLHGDFSKTNIDNPEYLMSSDSPSQTIDIPTVSEFVDSNRSGSGIVSHPPHKSLEEESDHEYYNDFDRLRRELQPLQRKSETAV